MYGKKWYKLLNRFNDLDTDVTTENKSRDGMDGIV